MRRFQVEQALQDGQQLDGDWGAAHLENRAAFHHTKSVYQTGCKQTLLTLPLQANSVNFATAGLCNLHEGLLTLLKRDEKTSW